MASEPNPYESPQPDVDESNPRQPHLSPLWFVGGIFFGLLGGGLSTLPLGGEPLLVAIATVFSAVTGAAGLAWYDRPRRRD